jgi:hypothetical protein
MILHSLMKAGSDTTCILLATVIRYVRPEKPVVITDGFEHPNRFDAHRPWFVVFLMVTTCVKKKIGKTF